MITLKVDFKPVTRQFKNIMMDIRKEEILRIFLS